MSGKGDKRRPGDDQAFRDGWERVWGRCAAKEKCPECGGALCLALERETGICALCRFGLAVREGEAVISLDSDGTTLSEPPAS